MSGTVSSEPVSLSVCSARWRTASGASLQFSISTESACSTAQPKSPEVSGLRRDGKALAMPLVHAYIEHAVLPIHEHEVELVEAKQLPRFNENALAELIQSPRTVQGTARAP